MKLFRSTFLVSLLVLTTSLAPLAASAQPYPTKPIRLVVPFPAGGTADLMGRLIAERLSGRLGQGIVVDNRGGAGGNVGAEMVATASPDGYTLMLGNASVLTINPHIFTKTPFDSFKDFTPIHVFAEVPLLMITPPNSPFKSVSDLIRTVKSQPGKWNYASGGNGSTTHLSMEMLKFQAGLDIVHIAYKGSGGAIPAVMSGEVPVMFELMPTAASLVKSNKLRALAVTSRKRSDVFPDVPTVAEAGLKDYEVTSWFGVFGPAGLPEAVTKKLATQINAIAADTSFKEQLSRLGAIPVDNGPQATSEKMRSEFDKWGRVVKGANIKAD